MKQTEKNILFHGTGEESEKREKKVKRFTVLIGCALLAAAVVLLFLRSDYAKNRLALLGTAAEYYVFVEQKNAEGLNQVIRSWYDMQVDTVKENGSRTTVTELQFSAAASALLKTYLDVNRMETEAEGAFYMVSTEAKSELYGSIAYEGEELEVLYEYDNATGRRFLSVMGREVFSKEGEPAAVSLEKAAASGIMKPKQLEKLLKKYGEIFFTELAKGTITLEDKALHSVRENAVYRRCISVSADKEQISAAVAAVFSELEKEKLLKELYAAAALTDSTYEELLDEIRQELSARLAPLEMKVYVDNNGTVTGREIALEAEGVSYVAGYGYVANNLQVCAEAYLYRNDEVIFFLDGICQVQKGALNGSFTVTCGAEGAAQVIQLDVVEVQIFDLFAGRFGGTVFVELESIPDAGLQIELDAAQDKQKVIASVLYGDAVQLKLMLELREPGLSELPVRE